MNERIKELAEQAGFFPCEMSQVGPSVKKFAELIVRKCADIAREVGTNTEPDDFALDQCYEIENKIKEHFGVES